MKEKQLRKIVKDIFEAGSNSHLGLQWVEPSTWIVTGKHNE